MSEEQPAAGKPRRLFFRGLMPVANLVTRSWSMPRPWEKQARPGKWIALVFFLLLFGGAGTALALVPELRKAALGLVHAGAASVARITGNAPAPKPPPPPKLAVATPPPPAPEPPREEEREERNDGPRGKHKEKGKKGKGARERGGGGGGGGGGALSVDDIVATVKQNGSQLTPCLASAKSRGELPAGSHKLLLDWTVTPAGTVRDARLAGPDYLAKGGLSLCVAGVIKKWQFPASASGAPVKNYPLGPVVVR